MIHTADLVYKNFTLKTQIIDIRLFGITCDENYKGNHTLLKKSQKGLCQVSNSSPIYSLLLYRPNKGDVAST